MSTANGCEPQSTYRRNLNSARDTVFNGWLGDMPQALAGYPKQHGKGQLNMLDGSEALVVDHVQLLNNTCCDKERGFLACHRNLPLNSHAYRAHLEFN
jgi:hypothetical protein